MPETAGAKTCLICGQDCSNRPRVKDPRGRYTCKDCLKKAQAATGTKPTSGASGSAVNPAVPARVAPAFATASDEAGVLSKLIDESINQQGPPCPSCGSPTKANEVMCVRCGFNRILGKAAKTQVQAAAKERLPRTTPRVRLNLHFSPTALFMTLMVVFGALTAVAIATESREAAMAVLAAFTVYSAIMQIMTIVWAFKDGDSGWGVIAIVSFLFGCLYLLVVYYIFVVSDRAYNRAMFLAWIITLVLTMVVMMNAGMTIEDLRRR